MKPRLLASRYSKGLLQANVPESEFADVQADLAAISDLLYRVPALKEFLFSPVVSREEKRIFLKKTLGSKLNPHTVQLLNLLLDKGRINCLLDVAYEVERQMQERSGNLEATVFTAIALDPENRRVMIERLEQTFSKKISLQEHISPKIEGGGLLLVSHFMLDGSIKNRLERLRNYLHAQ